MLMIKESDDFYTKPFANQENLRIFLICFFHGKGRNG